MQIGQRVNLIKKIATILSEDSYSDGDLVLRQFGLPWNNSWSGEAYNYYLHMVEEADSQKLIELYEFLFPSENLPNPQSIKQKGPWSEGMLRIFLSHSSTKKLLAVQLKEQLKDSGIDGFVAHEDIEPTKEWLKEIQIALNTCHALVAFICSNFKSSKYCDQEVGFALQRGILVIPVRIEEVDPYGFMAPLQAVLARDKSPGDIAAEIQKLTLNHPTTKSLAEAAQQKALGDLVDNFLNSSDFGTSSDLLHKLETYQIISAQLINKIADNWEKNDQISDCNGIPRRMKNLFQNE